VSLPRRTSSLCRYLLPYNSTVTLSEPNISEDLLNASEARAKRKNEILRGRAKTDESKRYARLEPFKARLKQSGKIKKEGDDERMHARM